MFLTDANFVARFEREARVVGRLDHPNIVPVYDYDLYENQPYLVMKLVEGKTLKEILNNGALPLNDILSIIPSVADALSYAHTQGVLHRDIKPSNIIIDNNGMPYLTDFGLARIARAGESTMSADMLLGTPYYISPEQAQGGMPVDSRADVYSLGVVLYELVVGRLPFTGDTPYIIIHKHIYEAPTPPSQINPEIPAAVEYVLLKALSKEPDDRYKTATELSNAFRQAVNESGLASLDDSRMEAARNIAPTPGGQRQQGSPVYRKDSQGNIVVIPSPFDASQQQPSTVSSTQALSQIFSQEGLREIGVRFREAMMDIRDQIQNRDNLRQLREGAEKAFVEIKSQVEKAVEENGGDFKFNFGGGAAGAAAGSATPTGDTSARRATKIITREWGTDDRSVRARVNERIGRRRGLGGHMIAFLIMGGVFTVFNPVAQQIVGNIFAGDETFSVLSQLNFAFIIMLFWGGGLVANMIDVFYNTGRRLELRRQAINTAMIQRYGDNWIEVANDKEYKKVRNQVNSRFDRRSGFFQHFFVALFTVLGVFAAWGPVHQMLLSLIGDVEFIGPLLHQTAILPLIFALIMALTVAFHGLGVFLSPVLGEEAHDRTLQRELERERQFAEQSLAGAYKSKNDAKAKNEQIRLTEDGEFTDSIVETLDDEMRRQRR
jgi:serine/threonine protein kinase